MEVSRIKIKDIEYMSLFKKKENTGINYNKAKSKQVKGVN